MSREVSCGTLRAIEWTCVAIDCLVYAKRSARKMSMTADVPCCRNSKTRSRASFSEMGFFVTELARRLRMKKFDVPSDTPSSLAGSGDEFADKSSKNEAGDDSAGIRDVDKVLIASASPGASLTCASGDEIRGFVVAAGTFNDEWEVCSLSPKLNLTCSFALDPDPERCSEERFFEDASWPSLRNATSAAYESSDVCDAFFASSMEASERLDDVARPARLGELRSDRSTYPRSSFT